MLALINNQSPLKKETILEPGIEFVGIINEKGRLEDFISVDDMPLAEDKKEMFFMELSLYNRMQQDFDDYFGSVKYNVTERGTSKFIAIPTPSKVILGVMKKEKDHTRFVTKLMSLFNPEIGSTNSRAGGE